MKISLLNSLKFRMPLVVLAGVVPLMLVAIFYASDRAAKTIRSEAKENLIMKTQTLAESVSRWEESNTLALATLTEQPDIIGMNPEQQKAVLVTVANNYQHIYLAHTLDKDGWIIARSDNKKIGAKGYRGDRTWFKGALAGKDLTTQVVISRTIAKPALCLSAPIRQNKATILGVTGICSDLEALTQQVGQLKFGKTGYAFIVDRSGTVLAHPDPEYLSGEKLKDLSYYSPVQNFLANNGNGDRDIFFFKDSGVDWISYQTRLNNDWGVIVVQEKAEFFKSEREFKSLVYFIAGATVIAVSILIWILADRLIAPLTNLSDAASAIANGKFDREIKLDRKDELGILANSFNRMTADLKSLFKNLEDRIEQRTAELKEAKETAEKAREVAETANESKDRFIANISHELRTPLNSIIGYNQIVQRDKQLNFAHLKHLKIVEKSSIYLLNLIDELLDISRASVDGITLYPIDLELEPFLNEVLDLTQISAREKDLTLKSEFINVPDWIQIDEKRLRQVLLNLLANAIKFTERGSVTLNVTAVRDIKTEDDSSVQKHLRFEVSDTGVGISPEDVQKIFQPFEQVGDIKNRAAGAGLGLAIASEFVKLMGGQLQVKSELGVGTTFCFDLIVPVLPQFQPVSPQILTSQIITQKETKPKILVVDDKKLNRDLLVEILQPKGFEVLTANNGQGMLETAAQFKPDLILLDLFMPVKTGFTSAKELREDPQLKDIPIIVVTASSITKEMTAYLDCDDLLHKPIDEKKLLILLHKYLAKTKLKSLP